MFTDPHTYENSIDEDNQLQHLSNLGLKDNIDKTQIFRFEKSVYNRKKGPNLQFHKNFTLETI